MWLCYFDYENQWKLEKQKRTTRSTVDNFSSDSNEHRNSTNENDLEDNNKNLDEKNKGDSNNIQNETM